MSEPLVVAQNVSMHFPLSASFLSKLRRREATSVRAVHNVSIELYPGETLGLVGETGCGKSTLGRVLLRLYEPTSGKTMFGKDDTTHMSEKELRTLRSRMQIIFQDPYSSLNPRHTVRQILSLPLRLHFRLTKREREQRIGQLLRRVGLQPDHADRYPHQFSGGQRQRIGIARALAVEPQFIVADEPVAALDVSVQAQILGLLAELQKGLSLTMLFISHDLSVVSHVSDRIAVMYLGKVVETGTARQVVESPLHPYTECLMKAVPEIGAEAHPPEALGGEVPSAVNPPSGCPFHPRCPRRITDACREGEPQMRPVEGDHQVACHLV